MAEPRVMAEDDWRKMAAELRQQVAEVPAMKDHPIFGLLDQLAEIAAEPDDGLGGGPIELATHPRASEERAIETIAWLVVQLHEALSTGATLAVSQLHATTIAAGWQKAAIELSSVAASLHRSGSATVTRDRQEAIAFVARNAGLRTDVMPVTTAGGIYAAERYQKAATPTRGKRIAPGTGEEVPLDLGDVSTKDTQNVVDSEAPDRTETT